ncbi:hypothetical protein MMC12_004719 [Toensbergia leucococca]|nr:hypothetical protein [Toensbergia leucococca]
MPYRVELAKSARAGCKNKICQEGQVKIQKGALRLGTLVDIQGNQSWSWKHWGCVTPKQIENIKITIEDNLDLLDGYDEVPSDMQATISKALEDGHVDDAVWDLEQNRPGKKGVRSPAASKKERHDQAENGDGDLSPTKPLKKKRGRGKKNDREESSESENQEPKPKRPKATPKKGKKAIVDDAEKAVPEPEAETVKEAEAVLSKKGRKQGRPTKTKPENGVEPLKEEGSDVEAAPEPVAKKSRAPRKARAVKVDNGVDPVKEEGSDVGPASEPVMQKTRAPRKARAAKNAKVDYNESESGGEPSEVEEVDTKPKARKKATGDGLNGTAKSKKKIANDSKFEAGDAGEVDKGTTSNLFTIGVRH